MPKPSLRRVSVVSYAHVVDALGTKYTVYVINVESEDGQTHSVFRRFSTFKYLHQQLLAMFRAAQVPGLPSKFVINRFSRSVVTSRLYQLHDWLVTVFALGDHLWRLPVFHMFLNYRRDQPPLGMGDITHVNQRVTASKHRCVSIQSVPVDLTSDGSIEVASDADSQPLLLPSHSTTTYDQASVFNDYTSDPNQARHSCINDGTGTPTQQRMTPTSSFDPTCVLLPFRDNVNLFTNTPLSTLGNYVRRALVGSGNFGTVYVVEHAASFVAARDVELRNKLLGDNVANAPKHSSSTTPQGALCAKLIRKTTNDNSPARERDLKRIRRRVVKECDVLRMLDHPFTVNLHDAFQNATCFAFVLNYCPGGSLDGVLKRCRRLPAKLALFYTAEVASALHYLHNKGIVYRDLKPENVLLDGDGHVVLTDFGMAATGVTTIVGATTICGTPEYLAPEIVMARAYGTAVDMWSLGVTLYELLHGDLPFKGSTMPEYFKQVVTIGRVPVGENVPLPRPVKQLVGDLLQKQPVFRAKTSRLRHHEAFLGLDWDQLEGKKINPPWKRLEEIPREVKRCC